ncbi:unnamed protein product [Sphagnum troendelagicum]|uniref:Glutaredoxin domain-containing protein n=1 Tax=Sphagnum troendelagicum TaxID=128251 RepID=A0ABP0TGG9_9BRYO
MAGTVKKLESKDELDSILEAQKSNNNNNLELVVLHFGAAWCEASQDMDSVEAEKHPDISGAYEVGVVPYFVFFKDGLVVDKLEGANPPELAHKLSKLATDVTKAEPASHGLAGGTAVLEVLKKELPPASDAPPTVNGIALKDSLPEVEKSELHKLVNSNPIMLFMKGTPEEPKCGFSRKVVAALKDEGVQFDSFNVLSDETVRQGIKTFSNWPTFPQLYVMGELLGGCDIVLEMHKSGELKQVFEEKGLSHTGAVPNDTPEQVVAETVPAVSLVESAATENAPPSGELKARIQHLVNKSPIMLFMKGTPQDPRCKFSRKVVQALGEEGVVYGSFDILSDESVRQGLKEYSNWPTYPQLYVKGEFIGGCDIILEMHQNGELKEILATAVVESKDATESGLKGVA